MDEKITVVMLMPGEESKVVKIGSRLEDLQKAVGGGYIEAIYPFRDDACIICNDEGKFNGMKPNRTLYGERKEIVDIIYGPFFVCGKDRENFTSLSPELARKYEQMFKVPERVMMLGGRATMVPMRCERSIEKEAR